MSRATFFGEVLPWGSSAGDIDFDEDYEQDVSKPYKLVAHPPDLKLSDSTENVIFCLGDHAAAFAAVSFLSSGSCDQLGSVSVVPNSSSDPETGLPVGTGRLKVQGSWNIGIFRLKDCPGTLVVNCPKLPISETANDLTEKFFEMFNPDKQGCLNVFILTTKALKFYKSPKSNDSDQENVSIVRLLSTDRAKSMIPEVKSIRQLKPPNMMDGFPASVMTHCAVHEMTGVLCVVYVDSAAEGGYSVVDSCRGFMLLRKIEIFRHLIENEADVVRKIARNVQERNDWSAESHVFL